MRNIPSLLIKKIIKKAVISLNGIQKGFVFQSGKTKIHVQLISSLPTEQPASMTSPSHPSIHGSPGFGVKPKNKSPRKIIFMSSIVLVFLVLILSGSDKKSKTTGQIKLRTEEDRNKEFSAQEEMIKSLKQARKNSGKSTPQFQRAQVGYIKGFRDYQKGQYERAIQYFQECLSIYPSHKLL